MAAITRPHVEVKEAAYLTPEQVKLLLEASRDTRYGLLFELLVNTGLRRGEALALKWRSHIKEDDGWLKIRGTLTREDGELVTTSTKTAKSRREVPITGRTAAIIQQLRTRQAAERDRAGSQWKETGYAFTTSFGEPCDPRNALRALKAAAERAGLPSIGLHTLRHSATPPPAPCSPTASRSRWSRRSWATPRSASPATFTAMSPPTSASPRCRC